MGDLIRIDITVSGMTCTNCALRIETNLQKIPGVNIAVVDLTGERTHVSYDPEITETRTIIDCIERIGYHVALASVDWFLSGSIDQSSATNLQEMLKLDSGVLSCDVDPNDGHVSLQFLPGTTSINSLVTIIKSQGFDFVVPVTTQSEQEVEDQFRQADSSDQKKLLILGVIVTIPLIIYSMLRDFGLFHFPWDQWLMLSLATIVQFIVGARFYRGAWKSLRYGTANMDVLIVFGSSIAYFSSLLVTIGIIKSPNVYFETCATIITLIRLGTYLETRAKGKANEALSALMHLQAPIACILRDGKEYEIPVDQVSLGDTILVRPGSTIPVDGIIIEGKSIIIEAMITGESMPVNKGPGDAVIGATINQGGLIQFQATKVGNQTALAQIIRFVRQAQASKAPIQKITDEIGRYFVPIIIGIALFTFFGWIFIAHVSWTIAMINAIAVLVIACPCALGLATPTAIVVGTSRAASQGILFKNSESLERAGKAHIVVLDKTGTITTGTPNLTDIIPLNSFDKEELLRLAASAETGSEHPLGRALVNAAIVSKLNLSHPHQFQSHAGYGIQAVVDGLPIRVGNLQLMRNESIETEHLIPEIDRLQSEGKTVMVVALASSSDNTLHPIGILAFMDTIKTGAAEALADLRKLGLELVMITGDNRQTAEAIARQVGIERVFAEVLPGDKAIAIKQIQATTNLGNYEHPVVMMVGDGINDAPALAQADVSMALGSGSDIAISTAGITLVGNDLSGISRAIAISRGTSQTIIQNLVWALFYNVALIPIAAYGLLIPMFAAGAMAFSSLFVVTNSLRLKSFNFNQFRPRKKLVMQILNMIPHIIAPAVSLATLIIFPMVFMNSNMEIIGVRNQDMSPELMMVMAIANATIAISYASIPFFLIVFVRRRKDIPFTRVFLLFGLFILACGTTHLMHVIGLWQPVNWWQAAVDSLTAVISLATAIFLWPILPRLLAIPSPEQLRNANRELQKLNSEIELRVQQRTADLEISNRQLHEEIKTRKIAEAAIQLNAKRLKLFVDILQSHAKSIREYLDEALSIAIQITDSQIGYLYLYDESTAEFTINSWSGKAMESCSIENYQTKYQLDKTGLWGEAVRQRRQIMVNNFQAPHPHKKGYPAGHSPLHNFLTIPVFNNDKIVCVVGVSNKASDYNETDSIQLTILMDIVWKVVERMRADEEVHLLNTKLEERVTERTAQLEAANNELEAFSYTVSHDLRAPLRHLDGYVDLLVSKCRDGLSEKGLHYVDIIASSARQMGTLIDDLLQFSRNGRGELRMELIDMNHIFSEAMDQIKTTLEGRNIEWDIGDLPPAHGDHALMRQVWINLLGNAVKYTRKLSTAHIQVRAEQNQSEITYIIKDDGVGFDMQYANKLFGVFQRLHHQEEFEGTGIGLATVNRIITRHGGRIWAQSSINEGATFHFTLHTNKE